MNNLRKMGKTSHQNLNDLVKELQDHLQKLNSGNLKLDEMENLVNSAKEIYERLVVMRHKAYENFGEPSSKKSTTGLRHADAAQASEKIIEQPKVEKTEPKIESPKIEKIEPKIEATTIQPNAEAELKPFDFTAFQDDSAKKVPEPKIVKQSSIAKDFDFSEDAFDEPEIEEKPEPIVAKPIVKKSIDVVRAEMKSETPLHEKYLKEDEQALNQTLKGDTDLPLRKKLQNKEIKDYRKEIGIGKKFEYINFLFGGDAKAYEAGIDSLNACESKDESKQKLNEFGSTYNWNYEEKTIVKFIELIERKFL